jgi:hypothetical protein
MADELTDDELAHLIAGKRAELGIVLDDAPPPAKQQSYDAVEAELAMTANVMATAALERRLQRSAAVSRETSLRCPTGPDLSLVDLVHRGHDGYIPFTRKAHGDRWQELGCVPANVLRGLFGAEWLTEELEHDSYFSLHGMFRHGYYRHRTTLDGLQPSLRKARHVRWLTTCHLDLDLYNVGLEPEDGVAAVLKASRDGIVPPPSMFSLSRGCWAWWLLRADDGTGPVRAWPDAVDRWTTIQGTLHKRLAKLGSDRAALHAATCSRIPGSTSSKTRRRVSWMACFDDDDRPFVYTLSEMADALDVPLKPTVVIEHRPDDGRAKDPSRIERGRRGYHSRWQRYVSVLDQLRRMRGGWRVGTRSKALSLVAHACRARGLDTPTSMAELERHLDGMEQPNTDPMRRSDLRRILKSATKPTAGGVRWQTVADLLDVTPDEAAVLSTSSSTIPPARRFDQLPAAQSVPPAERQRRRQETLRRLLEPMADYAIPPTRVLNEMLMAEGHDSATARTLLKDLVAIGRPSPRRHKPRKPDATQLDLIPPNGP